MVIWRLATNQEPRLDKRPLESHVARILTNLIWNVQGLRELWCSYILSLLDYLPEHLYIVESWYAINFVVIDLPNTSEPIVNG